MDVMAKVSVDALRCEGAKKCAQVCPEGVFRMEKAPTSLPILVLVKVFVHGGRQAIVVNEAACTACGKCLEVCPEDAIRVTAEAPLQTANSTRP
jgi:NAD-dependent dihydropyrimidine dehydrogenase PreA subunit